mgnify:CR=1 FL=1
MPMNNATQITDAERDLTGLGRLLIDTPHGAIPLAQLASLACGIAALLLLRPDRGGLIGRGRGVLLLMLYAGFVWLTLTS